MEEIIKSLEGKSMTKKSLFDFLSDVNIEDISSVKSNSTTHDIIIHPVVEELPQEKKKRGRKPKEKLVVEELPQEKKKRGRKPKEKSMEKPVENHVEKADIIKITTGIHSLINELLEKATTNIILECKFCSTTFNTKHDHHNHYSISTKCNVMAYNEFKKLILIFRPMNI
jgi:hypothetical protein